MSVVEGHAWVAEEFGVPIEVLSLVPRSWEAPPTGALLVEVAAAGVGLPDLLMTRGDYPLVRRPPVSPGQEVCGTVLAVGAGSRFEIGQRVFGPTHFYAGLGGFATHTYVTEGHAAPAPSSLTDEQAAGFFIGFRTAHTALVTRAKLQPDESVLVLGGSGGTGAAAISLAKALGGHVVAVASTVAKREFCRSIGADATVDREPDAIRSAVADHTDGRGFDVVIDPVGGETAGVALSTVARYGRFAAVGFASGSWAPVDAADMARRNYSVVGVLAAGFTPEENQSDLSMLCELAADGRISTPLGKVVSLADVPNTIASLGDDGARPGKLVVRVGVGEVKTD